MLETNIANNAPTLVFLVFRRDGFQDPFPDPPRTILESIFVPFWRALGGDRRTPRAAGMLWYKEILPTEVLDG